MSEDLQQLQVIEQNINSIVMQRQHIHSQLLETKNALSELEKTTKAYKIIGNIMVENNSEELSNTLNDKKERLSVHLKRVKEQEEKLQAQAGELQKKIMASEKNGNV